MHAMHRLSDTISRRSFVAQTVGGGVAACSALTRPASATPLGANDAIRVGVIGVRGKGGHHLEMLRAIPGVRVVALCDVDQDVLEREAKNFRDRSEPIDTYMKPSAPMPDPSAALSRMQLEMAAAVYAKVWGDAEATRTRGYAPLPHQTVALERAGAALERLRPEGARDLDRALEHDPGLAARGVRDRAGLVAAMTHEGRWRTEPGYRAEHYGQTWHGLEQAYAAAHRPVERAAVRGRMETFVDRLEHDPEGERQLLVREAGRGRARGDEPAPPLRELVAERERARAWEEERARVLIRKRSRGLSL